MIPLLTLLLLSLPLLVAPSINLGVNYGQLGDNLPSPIRSAALINRIGAGAVKIYDANPSILRALAGTSLTVSIMVPNEIIPSVATNYSAADAWVAANLLPSLRARPRTRIRHLLVGNEILSDRAHNATWFALVPAIRNLHAALRAHRVDSVKVSTTHAMDVLLSPSPSPSAAAFRPDIAESVIRPLLRFLNGTRSYFFIDAYPYFAWSANNKSISIDYALFTAGSSLHRRDAATGLTYTNLLDEQLDSVIFAMEKLGYGDVRLGIAETGWPHAGDYDQIGANLYNSATYNRNLVRHLGAGRGTPKRPGIELPAFVFALYDENQKPGPGTERHWGLYYPDETSIYPLTLSVSRAPELSYPPLPPATNNEPYKGPIWCVLNTATRNNTAVAGAVEYACGQGNGTCDAIQRGGKCYEPNTLAAHASYAFNTYWNQFRGTGGTCFFSGLAVQTLVDPSYGTCKYVSSTA